MIFLLLLTSCIGEKQIDRKISSLPLPAGKGGEIQGRIYKYKWPLSFPPVNFYAMWTIKRKLKKFVKSLPLEKEVRKRVLKHLSQKNLRKSIIPFLLSVREFYVPSKQENAVNFRKHIMEKFPDPKSIPGLEHTLFAYKEKTKQDKDETGTEVKPEDLLKKKGLVKFAIAAVLTLYDSIIIQDPNFKLGKKPILTKELLERVGKTAKKIMLDLAKVFGDESSTRRTILFFASNPEQVNAVASTVVDVIHKYVYELHQMFALSFDRKSKLKKFLLDELDKKDQGQLWDYLDEVNDNKRFAVHYIVDGLQGHLVRELSQKKSSKQFLKKIIKEHDSRKSFKPLDSEKPSIGIERNVDFLKYLEANKLNFENPNYLPFFKNLFRNNAEGIVKQGLSTTPTLSGRNIPVAQSGAPVYGKISTGLPNFNFLDRESEFGYYWLGNQAFSISRYIKAHGAKSLFERMPQFYGLNCSSVYMEGMNLKIDGYLTVTLGEKKRDFGEILCYSELKKRAANYVKLQKLYIELSSLKGKLKSSTRGQAKGLKYRKAKKILKKISKLSDDSLPTYVLIYNAWADHFSHYTGPFADEVISPTGELNRLDFWLTKYENLYKEAGVYDSTLFAMAGDHGLSQTYYQIDPVDLIFEPIKKHIPDLKIERISVDPNGPSLVDINKRKSLRGNDAVIGITAGANFVLDLFRDHKENWKTHPYYENLLNHKFQTGEAVNMIDAILSKIGESLDYMILRTDKCNLETANTILLARRNGKDVQGIVKRRKKKIYYSYEGVDLLNLTTPSKYKSLSENDKYHYSKLLKKCISNAKETQVETWCNEDEWFLLESFTSRPGGATQLAHLFDGGKSGTINLFPRQGVAYSTKKIGRHGGEHFHEKDALVGIWGAPVKGSFQEKFSIPTAVNGSIPPTIFEFLMSKDVKVHEDGWGYPSLFKLHEQQRRILNDLGL